MYRNDRNEIWEKTWGTINWSDEEESVIIEKAKKLVADGVDINMWQPEVFHPFNNRTYESAHYTGGYTPLMKLVGNGRSATAVKEFLKLGANPNVSYRDGQTPLMWATGQKNIEAVEALIDAGARLNDVAEYDETALYFAVRRDAEDIVKLLIKKGAKIDLAYIDWTKNENIKNLLEDPEEFLFHEKMEDIKKQIEVFTTEENKLGMDLRASSPERKEKAKKIQDLRNQYRSIEMKGIVKDDKARHTAEKISVKSNVKLGLDEDRKSKRAQLNKVKKEIRDLKRQLVKMKKKEHIVKRTEMRFILESLRKEFASDNMRKIIPNKKILLKMRKFRHDAIEKEYADKVGIRIYE